MWQYKQPGFALRLLCELQKQQQCSLHCDILLQTEGVSIPAHSCVLSALSPVFCRAFANVPLLPTGQSRLVQLEAAGARALMKLVGFMYSGELEGQSLDEQQEVIDIAYRLGFSNFMVGKQEQVNRHQNKSAGLREIGMQTEDTGGRVKDASVQILPEKRRFSGTQTDSVEAYFADTCIASEPELSIDLPYELTDVTSEYNISPDDSLAWIDKVVARSPSNSTEALVRVHTKCQRTQKGKIREKNSKKVGKQQTPRAGKVHLRISRIIGKSKRETKERFFFNSAIKQPEGTQISFKIKLKRQRSGALWEIVSVQGESTADGAGICGSSDATPMTHSVAELPHKTSVEVQMSSSPLLTCQNLDTVTLTPTSDLTTPLTATTTRLLSEHISRHTPHPVPPSSPLQMLPLSSGLLQPKESDEHIAKLSEMVTVGLNMLPSLAVEGNSSMHAQLDQRLETCVAAANSPASYLCLFGCNLGAMGSGTSSGTSEQKEGETEDPSGCRKWHLKNVHSVESYPTPFSHTSPCITQKKNIDMSFTSLSVTDFVSSKLTSGTEGLEHQNIFDLPNKTASNNLLWGADTCVQSEKQTVSDANEDCDQTRISKMATSYSIQGDPTWVGKQWPEQLHVTDQVSVWQTSDVGQAPNSDHFSEMRLPMCLSPLILQAGQTAGISTQDSLRPLAFSSCLSAANVNLQPTMRCTSPPVQPQALPGKTIQQTSLSTSLHSNDLHCSALGKTSCPSRSNMVHNGEASKCKSGEKKTKMPNSNKDLLKETEANILEGQMNASVVRETTARETVNEPCRKKAKVAGYPDGVDTQTEKVANPCSVEMNDLIHTNYIQDISNPVSSEKMDCLKAVKIKKTMPMDLKFQKNLALCQISQPFKRKGQEACQKYVCDTNEPASLVAKCGRVRPLQKRTGSKILMGDISKISKLDSSSAVLSALSSSSHHDLQVIQMNKECVPSHGSGSSPRVQQCLSGHAQSTTKVKDLTNECEKNKIPEPEMENPPVDPEKVILDINRNREENKQPKKYASFAKKKGLCDKIFHQPVYSVGTTVTQHLSFNPHIHPNFPTTNKKITTSLPPSLTCKKLEEPPEPNDTSTKLMMDNSKQKEKDKTKKDMETNVPQNDKPDNVLNKSKDNQLDSKSPRFGGKQAESSSNNGNGCLVNGSFVKKTEILGNTDLCMNEADLNAAACLCTVPPEKDFNGKSGVDLQNESSFYKALLDPFAPKNVIEKQTTDKCICEVPFSNEPTEVKVIKIKDLHIEETKSTQIVNLEGQKIWEREKEETGTAKETGHVMEIGRKNEFKTGIHDIEVDVMDETAQLAADHGDEVIATGKGDYDIDVEESQMSVEINNDVEDAHEKELGDWQVLRTEVMSSDKAAVERTSEMLNTEASSIQHAEEPDLSSSSINTSGLSAVFLSNVNTESAEECNSAEEELVVDEISDSLIQPCTVAVTHNTNLEEEEEEEEEVDVTGEESN